MRICHVLKCLLIVSWRYLARECIPSLATGLHGLFGHLIVGGADVAVVGLDALTLLEEVAEDLVKYLDVGPRTGGVLSIDPHEVTTPEDTHPDLVSEGGLP